MILALPCLALSTGQLHTFSRRGALVAAGGAALGAALPAHAVEEEDVKVYFGAGCFWHVQHEFVLKEAAELGRSGAAFSAVTGYAGGTGTERGLVCYHNGRGVSDYGRLGHAEAVQVGPAPFEMAPSQSWPCACQPQLRCSAQVSIPPSALPAFASKFIGIFGSRGYRHDPQVSARARAGVGLVSGLVGEWEVVKSRARARARPKAGNGTSDGIGTGVGVRAGGFSPDSPYPSYTPTATTPSPIPPILKPNPTFAGPRRRVPFGARAAWRDQVAVLLQVLGSGRGLADEAGGSHAPDTPLLTLSGFDPPPTPDHWPWPWP